MFGKISACLMAILSSASWIIGQSTFGSIVGVVKDPGEGTVAGAQITLTKPGRSRASECYRGWQRIFGDSDIAKTVVEFARRNQITQIFVAHSQVGLLERLRGKNFTEDIVRLAQDLQVTVVADRRQAAQQGFLDPSCGPCPFCGG